MDASTKKMLKTFGIIVSAIVVLFVVAIIFLAVANSKVNDAKLLNIIENAAMKYYATRKNELPGEGLVAKVTAETLITNKYMKPFSKLTKNTNCSGEVKVSNNGGVYQYEPSVTCNEYKSVSIATKLSDDVVTEGEGLYLKDGLYYFRGEKVNNYIKLGNTIYRIMSFNDETMKIIDTKLTDKEYLWDNRYSHDAGSNLGINDYSKSRLREIYGLRYNEYDARVKKYIVKANWCVGKRSKSNFDINNVECEQTIEDYLGTITPYEYAAASIDEYCLDIRGGSCNNYNYITSIITSPVWTAVAVSDNSYQAYLYSSGITTSDCKEKNKLLYLFNISVDNVYVSGDGSKMSPYTIR